MNSLQILHASAQAERLWKNGGGRTRDLVVFPIGSEDEQFIWRASVATIDREGPFSRWVGVDRAMHVLDGLLGLSFKDQKERLMHAGAQPLTFNGEDDLIAQPIKGPCTVFNVMVKRGHASSRTYPRSKLQSRKKSSILIFARENTKIIFNENTLFLNGGDVVISNGPALQKIISSNPLLVTEIFIGNIDNNLYLIL